MSPLADRVAASIARPAAKGGSPLLDPPGLGTAQLAAPSLPRWQALRATIARGRADELCPRLEAQLAELHRTPGQPAPEVVALSNASYGLVMVPALLARGRPGPVAMSSFSFRGLPYLAVPWGRRPRFLDVTSPGGVIDPQHVERVLAREPVACVLAVHNVHWRCDVDAIGAIAKARETPVFYDSVWALGATTRGRPTGGDGVAEVFSLHATKLLNGFEGGYVTTHDAELAAELRRLRAGLPCSQGLVPGLPCTLPPAHAAMALACLDTLPEVVARNHIRWDAWDHALADIDHVRLLRDEPGETHARSSALLWVDEDAPFTRDHLLTMLNRERILARRYFDPPLHVAPQWTADVSEPLPGAEALSQRILQLPVGELVSVEVIAAIGQLIRGWVSTGACIQGETP